MTYILVGIYLLLCIPVAIVGTGSRLGFFGTLIFAILLTPLLMIFLLIMLRPPQRKVCPPPAEKS